MDEAKLIANTKKADAERYRDLPALGDEAEEVRLKKFTDLFIQMCEKYLSPDEEDTDCADSKGDRE